MRNAVVVALMWAVAGLAASCSSPTSPTPPELFTIAPGQSAEYRQLSVTFEEVVVDSRCPEEAFVLCIQFGDAYLKLRATTPHSTRQYDVQVVDPVRRRFEHAGYDVEVTALEPRPFISGPIDPKDYRLTVAVRK